MQYNILAVGDVVGEGGLAHLARNLRALQKWKDIRFTVVNEIGRASCRERV